MRAVDTSVIVAAFASWHQSHRDAAKVVAEGPELIAHCAVETYTVLTRLPVPHRAEPPLVAQYLDRVFPRPPLVLPAASVRGLAQELARAGIVGGASYDALVAMTARHHGLELVSLDQRAAGIYRALGVSVELLGSA